MSPVAVAETRALGTTARVCVGGDATDARAAEQLMTATLGAFDRTCSRFRDDSDLSRVNRRAGRAVVVDPLLCDAVDVALRAARVTDGLVDPTVGNALLLLGYDDDFAAVPASGPRRPLQVHRVPGWRCVEVDRARSTVRVPTGTRLDLGATAKALGADRSATTIAEGLGISVLVSLGGDLAIAGPPLSAGWSVRVTDDHAAPADAPGERVQLHGGGLATSSTTVRRWQRGDEVRHHVVDPTSGCSAAGPYRTVSVAAGSCVDANIASTASIVLGAEAPAWLEARHLPARLVRHDGTVVHVAGWGERGGR